MLYSFWKEEKIATVKIKGCKIMIYEMRDEFEQTTEKEPVRFVWVEVAHKTIGKFSFAYAMKAQDYEDYNFGKVIKKSLEKAGIK